MACCSIPWLHVPVYISRCKRNKLNKQTGIVLWLIETKKEITSKLLTTPPRQGHYLHTDSVKNKKFRIEIVGDKVGTIFGVSIRPKIKFLQIGMPTCGRGKWEEGQYCALHSTGGVSK